MGRRRGRPARYCRPCRRARSYLPRPIRRCLDCGAAVGPKRRYCSNCLTRHLQLYYRSYTRNHRPPPRWTRCSTCRAALGERGRRTKWCDQCSLRRRQRLSRRQPSRLSLKACIRCGKSRRSDRPLCRHCAHEPTIVRCRCGNTFTPWIKRDGTTCDHARRTCGLCLPKIRDEKRRNKETLRQRMCKACCRPFIIHKAGAGIRYCGRRCATRYFNWRKKLRRRLGLHNGQLLPVEVEQMARSMVQVRLVVQGRSNELSSIGAAPPSTGSIQKNAGTLRFF